MLIFNNKYGSYFSQMHWTQIIAEYNELNLMVNESDIFTVATLLPEAIQLVVVIVIVVVEVVLFRHHCS